MSNTDLLSGDAENQTSSSSGSDNVTVETAPQTSGEAPAAPKKRSGGLSSMVIAELRQLAGELGITGISGMRKGELIAAIRERQGTPARARKAKQQDETLPLDGVEAKSNTAKADAEQAPKQQGGKDSGKDGATDTAAPAQEAGQQQAKESGQQSRRRRSRQQSDQGQQEAQQPAAAQQQSSGGDKAAEQGTGERQEQGGKGREQQNEQSGNGQGQRDDRDQSNRQGDQSNQGNRQNDQGNRQDDDRGGRRGRRSRDRRRRGRNNDGGGGGETEIREDDVLLPVAGILDVLDNYAFVRTSGYLAGPNDVYVSLSLVRKYGLRRGDAITGVVRQPREGEQQRQKFNPLVRVDTINGLEPDKAKNRPEFHKLTPLYPNERLRLETEPHKLTTRVIDLIMPVGKGQRALIVSPPKAGKTTILQDIANAITTNNPECWLMVVLVDERPEEVTDMQRNVKGEVIASTFDRPPSDHTTVAELSIERAKRLTELGHDVVVLLDSITRLGRAYNLAAPASGRILSGGVDSTALYPPKRFLGAARNIENGGSLTIFATAMVETGSTMDTVIFEEFKGTGNAELKLDRKIAERRVFPAVDVNPSGTRKEELLLSPDELAVTVKLHRVLHALDSQQAIDLLLSRLRKTKNNYEFLMQVAKTAPDQNGVNGD
ncbi:transcription termination factor Rho [Thermocrispum municipale]|uniref:transcription termination factor Rho n=1 Tax=Thermocrispum municipale TaxID=37926 RepID=UPI000425C778|nr:transcription termination factor Rho [Thermocrispum municipale]